MTVGSHINSGRGTPAYCWGSWPPGASWHEPEKGGANLSSRDATTAHTNKQLARQGSSRKTFIDICPYYLDEFYRTKTTTRYLQGFLFPLNSNARIVEAD